MAPNITVAVKQVIADKKHDTTQIAPTMVPNDGLKKLAEFFFARKFTDFEIRVGGQHTFHIHKNVISAYSRYFESCIGGGWKEAEQGYISLDESPVMVARRIQWIYCCNLSDYQTASTLTRVLACGRPLVNPVEDSLNVEELMEKRYITLAKLYAFADCYDLPTLKGYAETSFVAEVRGEEFDLTDLLVAINLVYNLTSDYDPTLRKWLVFSAQESSKHLRKLRAFTDELTDNTTFSIDLITKYAAANFVWCPECKEEIELVQCRCAFSGMCGYRLCTDQDWSQLKCTTCDRRGHLQRHADDEDMLTDNVGELKVKDAAAAVKTPPTTPTNARKRKNVY